MRGRERSRMMSARERAAPEAPLVKAAPSSAPDVPGTAGAPPGSRLWRRLSGSEMRGSPTEWCWLPWPGSRAVPTDAI